MLRSLVVILSTLYAVVSAVKGGKKRKGLTPAFTDDDVTSLRNMDTIQIVFDAACLETGGQTAQEATEAILEAYPCLCPHHNYPNKIFETSGHTIVYFDFMGSDKAMRNCIDDDLLTDAMDACLIGSEFETIDEVSYMPDYESDTCLGEVDTSWLTPVYPFWGLDYWDGIYGDDIYRYNEFDSASIDVDIYILDGSVDGSHEQFLRSDGSSRVHNLGGNATLFDDFFHGTMVAGCAAGWMTGTSADNFDIYAYTVCGKDGYCYVSDQMEGLTTIRDRLLSDQQQKKKKNRRRSVINMSFGSFFPMDNATLVELFLTPRSELFSEIQSYGAILVAAAGNYEFDAYYNFPSNSPDVIAVGAFDSGLEAADFSNYGDYVDVWAPGTYILVPGVYNSYWISSGTSFASPYVAGEVANLLQRDTANKLKTREDVLTILTHYRRSITITGYNSSRPDGIGVMGQCGEFVDDDSDDSDDSDR